MTSKNSKSKGTSTYRAATSRVGYMLRFNAAPPSRAMKAMREAIENTSPNEPEYPQSEWINVLTVNGANDLAPRNKVSVTNVSQGVVFSAVAGDVDDVIADIEQAREEARREQAERLFADIAPVIMRAQAMINRGNAHPFGVAEAPETNSHIVVPGRPRVLVRKRKRRH